MVIIIFLPNFLIFWIIVPLVILIRLLPIKRQPTPKEICI